MSRIIRVEGSFPLLQVDLLNASDDELLELRAGLGLGMSLEELRHVRDLYTLLERRPTDVELQTFDQTYSEHCSHKTFKGVVETPGGRVDSLIRTYLRRLVEELSPEWCFSVFEDNAGIVEFEGDVCVAVKVETHNHPSAIEPFGGAATGLGGVIRDILGVWAEPIANTDVLCFGPLDYPYEELPRGVKHPSILFEGVVDGIGSYGNSIGIPTVNGATVFDEGYVGNVLVYAGCIGLLEKSQYVRAVKNGDYVVLAGGRTGRDGIHGVVFASEELSEDSEEAHRSAVQIANPIEEEKVKRALREISSRRLGSGITDIGGGGLSCGVCEMANRYGLGVEVHLDRVPLKEPGLAPWEIWVSESQERMLLAVPPGNLEEVLGVFEAEQVEATVLGRFNGSGCARLLYQGSEVGNIPLGELFNQPRVVRKTGWAPPERRDPEFEEPGDLGEVLLRLLASYNICSKERVVRRYDHEVKGLTVVKPLQGWRAGPGDAAVLKPLEDSWRGLAVSSGINPRYGVIHPYWMAAGVLDEAVRNNVCVGGRRWALLDNFSWGNPELEDRLGGLVEACRALYDVGKAYGAPFISGKDSLYNESQLGPVAPTLLVTCVGVVPDIRRVVTMDLKEAGNPVYVLGETRWEVGGSEYLRLLGHLGGSVPRLRPEDNIRVYRRVLEAMDRGLVRACHDCSEGGLAVALSEMAFTGGLGVSADVGAVPGAGGLRSDVLLFSESHGRLLVEVDGGRVDEFEALVEGLPAARLGEVVEEGLVRVGRGGGVLLELGLERLMGAWKTPLGVAR